MRVALLLCCLLVAGCHEAGLVNEPTDEPTDEPIPDDPPVTIGEDGGTITGSNGTVVDIPAGSLDVDVAIAAIPSNETVEADGDFVQVGDVVEFLPAGTTFNNPVTVTMPYNPSDVDGDETLLKIWWTDDVDGKWVSVPSTVDTAANTVSGTVTHFSWGCIGIEAPSSQEHNGYIEEGWSNDDCNDTKLMGCYSSTYDAKGDLLTYRRDDDCDGHPDYYCATYSYILGSDPPLWNEQVDMDCDATTTNDCWAGISDAIEDEATWGYWGNDSNCDGIPDSECDSYRDAVGVENMRVWGTDIDCDGTPDLDCAAYRLDPTGEWYAGYDADCDGVPETNCDIFEFDADGYVVSTQYDQMCDGTPDGTACVTISRDGNSATQRTDLDCDGTPEAGCVNSTYDAEGKMLTSQFVDNCDGFSRECVTITYDANGRQLTYRWDDNCEGAIDSCDVNFYTDL